MMVLQIPRGGPASTRSNQQGARRKSLPRTPQTIRDPQIVSHHKNMFNLTSEPVIVMATSKNLIFIRKYDKRCEISSVG